MSHLSTTRPGPYFPGATIIFKPGVNLRVGAVVVDMYLPLKTVTLYFKPDRTAFLFPDRAFKAVNVSWDEALEYISRL